MCYIFGGLGISLSHEIGKANKMCLNKTYSIIQSTERSFILRMVLNKEALYRHCFSN
jgi:hypothetical protein